jgi:hypothetical protein
VDIAGPRFRLYVLFGALSLSHGGIDRDAAANEDFRGMN